MRQDKRNDQEELKGAPGAKSVDALPPASVEHRNDDLFIWALNLVGGRNGYVDAEDAYFKCFELAPKRFSWRTRPDLPDLGKLRFARETVIKRQTKLGVVIIDAKEIDVSVARDERANKGPAYQWRLTSAGVEWCDRYQERLSNLYGGGVVPIPSKREESRRVSNLKKSNLYKQWELKNGYKPIRAEIADLFECSPGSEKRVFNLRFDQALEEAHLTEEIDVAKFIHWIRLILEETYG